MYLQYHVSFLYNPRKYIGKLFYFSEYFILQTFFLEILLADIFFNWKNKLQFSYLKEFWQNSHKGIVIFHPSVLQLNIVRSNKHAMEVNLRNQKLFIYFQWNFINYVLISTATNKFSRGNNSSFISWCSWTLNYLVQHIKTFIFSVW